MKLIDWKKKDGYWDCSCWRCLLCRAIVLLGVAGLAREAWLVLK